MRIPALLLALLVFSFQPATPCHAASTQAQPKTAKPNPAPSSVQDAGERARMRLMVADFKGHTTLPPGWEVEVREGKAQYRVYDGSLILSSGRGDSYGLRKTLSVDTREYPFLNWRWMAMSLPAGGDGRRKATDDQAAQLYVVFPRWPAKINSRVIGYTWENVAPKGITFASVNSAKWRYIVLRDRSDPLGRWFQERRNVREDYRKLFGEEPPEIGAVMLYINSQHTASSGESRFGEVYFSRD